MRNTIVLFLVVVSFSPASSYADGLPSDDYPPEARACLDLEHGDSCSVNGAEGKCLYRTCDVSGRDIVCLKCLDEDGNVPSSGCDCSSISTPTVKEIGALLLAASFSLLFFLRRRRDGKE